MTVTCRCKSRVSIPDAMVPPGSIFQVLCERCLTHLYVQNVDGQITVSYYTEQELASRPPGAAHPAKGPFEGRYLLTDTDGNREWVTLTKEDGSPMLVRCICGWKSETKKPTQGLYRLTCPDCLSAVAIEISFAKGVVIISPTDTEPCIEIRYGAGRILASSEFDRRMRDPNGALVKQRGLEFLGAELSMTEQPVFPCARAAGVPRVTPKKGENDD